LWTVIVLTLFLADIVYLSVTDVSVQRVIFSGIYLYQLLGQEPESVVEMVKILEAIIIFHQM